MMPQRDPIAPASTSEGHQQATKEAIPSVLVVDDEQGLIDAYVHYLDPGHGRQSRPKLVSSRRQLNSAGTGSHSSQPDYNLMTASTGEDAVELVRQRYEAGNRIELGFFDMKMPGGIDGLETIRRILEIDPDVFCVIVTAYQDKPLDELAKVFGPDRNDQWDYLSKPFTGNEIIQKARNMTAAWQRRRAQESRESSLLSSVHRQEDVTIEREKDLAIANEQLRGKQGELEAALARLTATNARLQEQMEETERMERDLRMAQKLEAVGQLAAGIAHEISTPTQYIGNNMHFLSDAFSDLRSVVTKYEEAYTARNDVDRLKRSLDTAHAASMDVDLEFLFTEIPDAFEAISAGVSAISTIVGAMRNFAHPDRLHKELGDINRALENTLAVAHSEYRFLAEIETDFGEVPLIPCLLGGMSQVFLNLIINAAHAIEDANKDVDSGRIKIRTWVDDEAKALMISISDNGSGISPTVQEKMFDPFFTTKDVGRGTGQGLSIARDIVVSKHQGQMTVESTEGEGSTFTIALPV